jgi:hypothetical protein
MEADDLDAAIELAWRIPAARLGRNRGAPGRTVLVATLGQVFREQWGRVLAVLIGLLGDSTSPRTPRRRPRDRR